MPATTWRIMTARSGISDYYRRWRVHEAGSRRTLYVFKPVSLDRAGNKRRRGGDHHHGAGSQPSQLAVRPPRRRRTKRALLPATPPADGMCENPS